ncbi:MAG: molybdate ABC transporter substrate-binding protein [Micrococcales bacterium]|nr:molybdate ABC transporter substrate-binding protein [Micrococcales bacterium]
MAVSGCTSDDNNAETKNQTLTVFAAASLTEVFTQVAAQFEAQNEGVSVKLSFAGSSDLAAQILAGAPADVFASADTKNMDKLGDMAITPTAFASNTLVIVTPPGNPAGVTTFADLATPGLTLVICAPEVPCGAATQTAAQTAGVALAPVSQEQSVTDVLGKVSLGEADAGVVYVTDARRAGSSVEAVTFPESSSAVNTYPIAQVSGSKNTELAQRFIEFVLADAGQQVLAEAGFAKP